MKRLVTLLFLSSYVPLTACGEDPILSRHEVCEHLSNAACDRTATCEPTVSRTGCYAQAMARCCPDGVCAEPVIADDQRVAACEAAIATMSCNDLHDGDVPTSCQDLTDPIPPDAALPPDAGHDETTGVLEVNWTLSAGGTELTCAQFRNAQTVRIVATTPQGGSVTRDFSCTQGSALTTLPIGPHSIYAQLQTAGGQVIQQTIASTVALSATGASTSFRFTVTTPFGQYCSMLATQVCNACQPGDASCKVSAYNECCATAGVCNEPALADPVEFQACLDAYATGSFCGSTPPVCSGIIDVW